MAYTSAQRRQHILELQKYLYSISLFNDAIPQITPDGIYSSETAAAVRAFQKEYGLPQTGSTDPATWNKIVNVYKSYLHSAPSAYHAFPSQAYTIRRGDRGQVVYIIQAMLDSIADSYDNMPHVKVCGDYDPETVNAIKEFQRTVGLPQSGVVDSGTWNMLVHSCEHINSMK